MKEIKIEKKLHVYSVEDWAELRNLIGKSGYFSNEPDFDTDGSAWTLSMIDAHSVDDESPFIDTDGNNWKYFALLVDN